MFVVLEVGPNHIEHPKGVFISYLYVLDNFRKRLFGLHLGLGNFYAQHALFFGEAVFNVVSTTIPEVSKKIDSGREFT